MNKLSLAIAALVANTSAVDMASLNRSDDARYIGKDGKPINLAQTKGHLRLELTKIKKYNEPRPIESAMLLIEEGCGKQTVAEKKSGAKVLSTAEMEKLQAAEEITHCPINTEGKKVKAHIFQQSL